MPFINAFEEKLTGRHPNSLGNTIEVVDEILADQELLASLVDCYKSNDEVVRLRVSNAMKRICKERPLWLVPYIDTFLNDISTINQASTQWTLAQLFQWLEGHMDGSQKQKALEILKRNLDASSDWIVQNTTIDTLSHWAKEDSEIKTWLIPRLEKFVHSDRKSVAGRATKMLKMLQ